MQVYNLVCKHALCAEVKQILGFQPKKKFGDPPTPRIMRFLGGKEVYLKSCPRVPKLKIWIRRSWGRCLKVTLQTCALENFRLCRWGYERTVKREQAVKEDPHRRERNFLNFHLCGPIIQYQNEILSGFHFWVNTPFKVNKIQDTVHSICILSPTVTTSRRVIHTYRKDNSFIVLSYRDIAWLWNFQTNWI
jgi:hypothetical protein